MLVRGTKFAVVCTITLRQLSSDSPGRDLIASWAVTGWTAGWIEVRQTATGVFMGMAIAGNGQKALVSFHGVQQPPAQGRAPSSSCRSRASTPHLGLNKAVVYVEGGDTVSEPALDRLLEGVALVVQVGVA